MEIQELARWATLHRALGLSIKPLAGDSSLFEHHHVSAHFAARRRRESRRAHRRRMAGKRRNPAGALKRLPKRGVMVAAASHLILSMWCGTGNGSDGPHFEPLLFDSWRRVPQRSFRAVFDAGYDGDEHHQIARHDMCVRSIIPPLIGRPTDKPTSYWRQRMKRLLATKQSRRHCGYTQRWQVETVMSMIKRNLGSALRGRTVCSRHRDLALKVLTHNIMIIRRQRRVETEQDVPVLVPGQTDVVLVRAPIVLQQRSILLIQTDVLLVQSDVVLNRMNVLLDQSDILSKRSSPFLPQKPRSRAKPHNPINTDRD